MKKKTATLKRSADWWKNEYNREAHRAAELHKKLEDAKQESQNLLLQASSLLEDNQRLARDVVRLEQITNALDEEAVNAIKQHANKLSKQVQDLLDQKVKDEELIEKLRLANLTDQPPAQSDAELKLKFCQKMLHAIVALIQFEKLEGDNHVKGQ